MHRFLANGRSSRPAGPTGERRPGGIVPRRACWAAGLALAATVALAGCASGTAVESTAPAPSTGWQPVMAEPATEPLPSGTVDALQTVLEDWLAETALVGATAAVVSAEGVWQGASGTDAEDTALTPASAMAVYSISKTFTVAAVMRLVEAGLVDLDQPIDAYVDLPFETDGATVRQVANMRSGFPYPGTDEPGVIAELASDLDRSWSLADTLGMHAGRTDSHGELGGVQVYNDLNMWSLAALVESVEGRTIAEVVRSGLLVPAGLDRTWHQDGEEPQPPLTVPVAAAGTVWVDPDGPWLPSRSFSSYFGAANGMAASAPDLARWGYLLYGAFLLQPETVAQMTDPGQPAGYPCPSGLEIPTCYYGLGTELFDGSASVGHGGAVGTAAPYHAFLDVRPQDDASVAILVPATSKALLPGSAPIYEAVERLYAVLEEPSG